jgi:hypothetical protein
MFRKMFQKNLAIAIRYFFEKSDRECRANAVQNVPKNVP